MPTFLGLSLLGAGLPQAATAEAEKPAQSASYGDEEYRIREIFSSHLPDTIRKNSLRMSFHPHLGDFDNRDFLRVSTGIRYGLTKRWEIGGGVETYFSHGFGDVGFFDRRGLANALVGTKLNLGNSILSGWDSATGVDFVTPVDHPPTELTDGLRHFAPYLSFSRRLRDHPKMRVFWSVGVDLVEKSSIPGELKDNQLSDSSLFGTVGAVLDRGRLHYTLEMTLATTRAIGKPDEDNIAFRPGILWEIPPRKKTSAGDQKSNWIVGAALKAVAGPHGSSFGASAKLRVNLDLKRWLGRTK